MNRLNPAVRCLVWLLLVLSVGAGCEQKRTPAGQILQQYGVFKAPVGEAVVDITPQGAGQFLFKVVRPQSGSGPTNPLSAAEPWHLCWDQHGRLWSYTQRDGVQCHFENEEGTGVIDPGAGGGWDDVPPEFIAKLPGELQLRYKQDVLANGEQSVSR